MDRRRGGGSRVLEVDDFRAKRAAVTVFTVASRTTADELLPAIDCLLLSRCLEKQPRRT
jgi:hypothetical protein